MPQTLIPIIAVFGALAGVWLGSRLTANRSHREWIRERTAQAYSIILEALFDIESWFSVNLEEEEQHKEVDTETEQKRREAYRAAKDRLDRTLAREEWLLPDTVLQAFAEMRKVFAARYESWYEDLDASWGAVTKTRKKLVQLARRDLGKPLSPRRR